MFNLKDNQIQSKEVWLEKIAGIKKQVSALSEITDEKQAICLVKKSILEAFEKCMPNEKFGILFSGGIDSTLLAFLAKSRVALENFCCYASVMDYENVRQAPDLERAVSAAKKLGLNLKVVKTKLEDLENVLKQVMKITKRCDYLHISIGAALFPVIRQMKKDGLNFFMSGLGSDQVFAGGEKYRLTDNINEKIWQTLEEKVWPGDFSRDLALAKYFNFKMLLPFYDYDLIRNVMQISNNLKHRTNYFFNPDNSKKSCQKYILRLIAQDLGLPKELAWRRTRPTQYGSNFDKAIEKLTKKNGFKFKSDYLNYLKSLINLGLSRLNFIITL